MLRRMICAAVLQLLATGCAQKELYVVLPNADGRPGSGAISVSDGSNTTTLDQAYAAAETRSGSSASAPIEVGSGNAYAIFNQAIAARPILPHHFHLYFLLGSDALTPESATAYQGVFDDVHARKVYEVEVIGHTDTLGDFAYNQQLSLSRAIAIRDRLIADGIAGGAISVTGRGKLDLLVPTADQVPEPRNRYVDVLVR
jgi:outer membrane protein OmpA-like peptidoglycan-associated protein